MEVELENCTLISLEGDSFVVPIKVAEMSNTIRGVIIGK